jgi:hypothetical protein
MKTIRRLSSTKQRVVNFKKPNHSLGGYLAGEELVVGLLIPGRKCGFRREILGVGGGKDPFLKAVKCRP